MINSVVMMGRLTFDPELKKTPNGTSVINFQIAVDRSVTKGKERQSDFIDCQAWRNTAEFVSKYFKKGNMIAVEGSIQTNSYTDKDGNKRKNVIVVTNNVSFCESKNSSFQASAGGASATTPAATPAPSYTAADNCEFEELVDDDDLPF